MNRFSNIEDLASIAELRYQMFAEIGTSKLLVDDFKARTKEFYTEQYLKAKCTHVVYEHESKIVACAGGIIRSDAFYDASFKQPEYGYLMDVYVAPEYRRQGRAKELVSMLFPWFEEFDVSTVKLDASALSGDLYSKIGFQVSSQMALKINE